ncbi:MAG TPA: signal peptidase II [Kofleriaceae bacterium]|nr:signal peptidase II [Kofleriaceae bacterium]
MSRRAGLFFGVIFLVITGLDQGSKAWAHGLPLGAREPVISGYWDWELAYNPGAAFSSFPGGTWLLALVAGVAVVAIGLIAARTPPDHTWKLAGLAALGGGALGNLIDRVKDGAVTDFIRWHVHDHWWPIFNVADAALLVGAGLLLYSGRHERVRARAGGGG